MTPEQIACVCHEANRGLQRAMPTSGIPVAEQWDLFPADQQVGVISGVRKAQAGATPEELHEAWCSDKVADGWSFGLMKSAEQKTHPCLLPYSELPEVQKVKDRLFAAIVVALS